MGNGILHNLDATLPIISYNISSYIRLAKLTIDNNTIISTLLDPVSPDERLASCSIVITDNLNAVFVRFLNLVVKNLTFITLYLNSNTTYLNLILNNIWMNIISCNDSWWPAKSQLVSLNLWSWCVTLDEDSCCLATHDDVFRYDTTIFRLAIDHDGSRIEMCEGAFVDHGVTFERQNSSS